MSGINRHRCIGFGRPSGLRSRSRPVVTDHRLTTPTQREGAALRRPLSSRNRANSAGHRVGNRLAYALLALVTVEGVGVNALGDAGRGVAKYFCHVARGEPALSHFRRRTRAGIMRRSFRSVRQPCCGDDQRPGAKADRRSADANSGTEHMLTMLFAMPGQERDSLRHRQTCRGTPPTPRSMLRSIAEAVSGESRAEERRDRRLRSLRCLRTPAR
jgi:hypothetical protein